jgi:RNA polymerase sigma factor (sigma-70 family)
MTDTPDADLLEQFARDNSSAAFTLLVERHISLVHSVALRHTANPQHAQDITQAVFIILARKAGSLNRKTVLPGWLYHTARLTAANFQRAEISRVRREQEIFMQTSLQESAPDALWSEMSPLLDEAMARLGARDRDALVLRYFQNKSLSEVGIAMGLEERTAQKRVTRAIEKLRKVFAQRGVTLSGAAIAGAVSANSVQAAPVALVKTISAIAVAKGAAATTSTFTFVKGALKIMAWTKTKTVTIAGIVIFLAAGTTFLHFHLGKNSWRGRFDAVYKLKDGEDMRYIAPPFIDERAEYYRKEEAAQAKAVPRGPDFFIFKQAANGQLQPFMTAFGYKQHSLQQILDEPLGFRRYEIEASEELLNLNLTGDWTIRESVSREALLAALEPIVLKATGHGIHFEKRTVQRDVIVAHGHAKSPASGSKVKIYAEKLNARGSGIGSGNLQNLLGAMGEQLNIYIVNEAQVEPLYADLFEWSYYPDANYSKMGNRREELTDKVLKNLTTQMGLTFTYEQRPVDIWFVTEQP